MLLPKAEIRYKYLKSADASFDVNNFLGVTILNRGQTILVVNDEDVYPGEEFRTPDFLVLSGTINISFKPNPNASPGDKNRAMIKYARILGFYDLVENHKPNCNT